MITKQAFTSLLLSLIILVSISACNSKLKKKEVLMFSAEIENPNADSLYIENTLTGKVVIAFRLNNGVLSKDSVAIPMGYYRINIGKETTMCFLKPNYDLHLTLNTKEFDESIKYSGIGASENNYLAKKYLLEESFEDVNYYGYYANLEEEDFLSFVDSIYNLHIDLFNQNKQNFDKDFAKLEFNYLKITYQLKLADYESMHRFLTNNQTFSVSNKFPNPFADIILDDEMFLIISNYLHYVALYFQSETLNKFKENDTLSFYNTFIDLIDSELKNKKIKEEVAYDFFKGRFSYADNPKYCYTKLKKIISNPEYIKEIDESYAKLMRIEKGSISPTFELYDIDSNLVKLEDFKGKLIYIDIWATWCSPCIKEIPDLDKLQTELKNKNIVFISICQNDDKEMWKATVLTNKLQGIHLFVPDNDNKFLSDYLVNGVPRYILIDEKGYIIDADALRPSNPALKEQLVDLLK